IAALLLGAAISTWQAIRATRAERAAAVQADRANNQAAKANASLGLLQEMLDSANVQSGKGAEYTVRQLLDDFSASLAERLKGQPELEAALRLTVGRAYRSLGMTRQAKEHLEAAMAMLRQRPGQESERVASVLLTLAYVASDEEDLQRAIALTN